MGMGGAMGGSSQGGMGGKGGPQAPQVQKPAQAGMGGKGGAQQPPMQPQVQQPQTPASQLPPMQAGMGGKGAGVDAGMSPQQGGMGGKGGLGQPSPAQIQQMQQLGQQRDTYLQSLPQFQQLQQLSSGFSQNNQPTPDQIQQMQTLQNQIASDPRMQSFEKEAQQTQPQVQQAGMGGKGGQLTPEQMEAMKTATANQQAGRQVLPMQPGTAQAGMGGKGFAGRHGFDNLPPQMQQRLAQQLKPQAPNAQLTAPIMQQQALQRMLQGRKQ